MTNQERAFAACPDVYEAWGQLLGVLPDAVYRELDPALREALVVGRAIAGA